MKRQVLRWIIILVGIAVFWIAGLALSLTVVKLRVPVSLPSAQILGGKMHVSVSGTWIIEGEKQAFPLQAMTLLCVKTEKICHVASAQIMGGDQLMVQREIYEVESWEQGRVLLSDTSPRCVDYLYTIDIQSKAANGIRRNKKNPDSTDVCPERSPELRLSLKGGFEVTRKLEEDAMPWFGHIFMAPLKAIFSRS